MPIQRENHEPLAFLSGSFKRLSFRWSTPGKESFDIVKSITSLDYLLLRLERFWLFADHKMVYILNPTHHNTSVQKHVVGKIDLWALSRFRFTIVHITGEENVWADLLWRWGGSNQTPEPQTVSLIVIFTARMASDLDLDFLWPSF